MLKHTTTLQFPVDAVIEELCSEEFMLAAQRTREDVIDVAYELLEETPAYRRFAVAYTHHRRTKSGRLDRDAVDSSRTEYELRQDARALTWRHIGPESKRVSVTGDVRFVELGPNSSRIDREITIDIRIPVVGRAVAKVVEAQFRKGLAGSDVALERALASQTGRS